MSNGLNNTATSSELTIIDPTKIYSCPSDGNPLASCYWNENQNIPATTIITPATSTLAEGHETLVSHTLWVPAADAAAHTAVSTAPIDAAATGKSSAAPTNVAATNASFTATPTVSDASATNAAQTATTSATPSGTASQSSNSGAIAGAAIGCFIAGALVAALVSFFMFKKRSQRNRYVARSTYLPGPEPRYDGEKGTPMVSVAPVGNLDFLPQQADDAEVQRKLSTVIDQIDQHVENFYSNRNIRLNADLEGELSRFETSELAQPLAACFEHTTNPTALIKHCLAFHIFNLTLAPGEGTQPLLPAELAGTIAAVYNKSLSPSTSNGKYSLLRRLFPANDMLRHGGCIQLVESSYQISTI